MPTPFHTEVYDDCATCKLRPFRHFCNLEMEQVGALQKIKKTLVLPPDVIVFNEGDVPEGVFILCSGRVKLFSATPHGKIFILKIARPGELLGLNATIMGQPYLVSAETVEPCQINFVPRDAFLRYVKQHNEASAHVIEQLAENYYAAQREIQSLGLAQSARQVSAAVPAVAHYLIQLAHDHGLTCEEGVRVDMAITVRELALILRAPTEQVTAAMNNLEDCQWLYRRRSSVIITNPSALERVAAPVHASHREGAA